MLSVKLDPDLEQLLEQDVDDLARHNILRYLHDSPSVRGGVHYFSEELGLRSLERTAEALEALVGADLLVRVPSSGDEVQYCLTSNPAKRDLVDRLCRLSFSPQYGEIVERLAAKSLRRARKAGMAAAAGHKAGHEAA